MEILLLAGLLSGMLMFLTGRLPKVADHAEWEGWRFEIVDLDARTIDKVLATRREQPPEGEAGA